MTPTEKLATALKFYANKTAYDDDTVFDDAGKIARKTLAEYDQEKQKGEGK